jgi:uncharacterized repeat protein (TIGR03803 family)
MRASALRFSAMAASVAMSLLLEAAVDAAQQRPQFAGGFKIVHSFHGFAYGDALPPLTLGPDGRIYGVTINGYQNPEAAFALSRDGRLSVLHVFRMGGGPEGYRPAAGLAPGPGGLLYGITEFGGAFNYGTLYSLDPKTRAVTVLHAFTESTFDQVWLAPLQISPDGVIYAATTYGGGSRFGHVFAYDTKTSSYSTIYAFTNAAFASMGVTLAPNGLLYGTTVFGGTHHSKCDFGGCGTLFSLTPSGSFTIIHRFSPFDGSGVNPNFQPIVDASGAVFGQTQWGGAFGAGTLFRTGGQRVRRIFSFDTDGVCSVGGVGLAPIREAVYSADVCPNGPNGEIVRIAQNLSSRVLYQFTGGTDGRVAFGLLGDGDVLYGISAVGPVSGKQSTIIFTLPAPRR